MAANNFVGTTNSNWSRSTNWSLGAVPTASDGNVATFTSSSPACTINTVSVCNAVDFTNYTHTITFTSNLTVSGNVTLGTGMSFAGGATLIVNATSTFTPNGVTMTVPLNFLGVITVTMAGNLAINSTFSTSPNSGGVTLTINGFSITGTSNFSLNTGSSSSTTTTAGTTALIISGSSSKTFDCGGHVCNNPITINCTGNLVLNGFSHSTGTITYTSCGTISGTSTTSGAISFNGTTTLDFSSTISNVLPINFSGTGTLNLASNLYLSGTVTGTFVINNFSWFHYGSITSSNLSGTTAGITFSGTSTSMVLSTTTISLPITFNCTGTVTISGTITIAASLTITYTLGTIITTGSTIGALVNIGIMITLNTGALVWNNITIGNLGSGLTINSNLVLTGTLTIDAAGSAVPITTTILGNYNITMNSLSFSQGVNGGVTLVLVAGQTYKINSSISYLGGKGTNSAIKSSSSGTRATLTLVQGATQSVSFITATDIDSSAGQTIWCWNPTLSNTLNWSSLLASSIQKYGMLIR